MSAGAPAIAAVPLGCCPDLPPAERCVLCGEPPQVPVPLAIRALVQHTRDERARPGQPTWVGFYGGPPPSNAQLAAAQGAPVAVRVRPDRLTRADAARLVEGGVVAIELDVLTLDRSVLRAAGRRYGPDLVREQLEGLRALGVEVGATLAPGLPGSSHDSCLADASALAPLIDTARLHPVLVVRHSGLYQAMLDQTYTPLTLGEAVTVCRDLLERLEAASVRVLRVGQQAGPDGLGPVVSGPEHPSLRELVEARRALDALRALFHRRPLDAGPDRGEVVVRCAPADESRARGPRNQHVRTLRAEFGLREVRVEPDPDLPRGTFDIEPSRRTG